MASTDPEFEEKAADVIGVGRDNVILVEMDPQYRLKPLDLERKILAAHREGKVPLAVVATVGTTEEGAVDPLHEVLDVRARLEREQNISFWLHIDAAWGGYLRSLFCLSPDDTSRAVAKKLSRLVAVPYDPGDPGAWERKVLESVVSRLRGLESNQRRRLEDVEDNR